MSNPKKTSRRNFLKSLAAIPALPLLGKLAGEAAGKEAEAKQDKFNWKATLDEVGASATMCFIDVDIRLN